MDRKIVRVLSLGAGVQSSTLALLYEQGKLTPKPDFAIFADTRAEPDAVYDWLGFLKTKIKSFPIYTYSKGDIADDVLYGDISIPAYTRKTKAEHKQALQGYREEVAKLKKEHPEYWESLLPARPRQTGILYRQCTKSYKILPVYKKIREILGYAPYKRIKEMIHLSLGISTDEVTRRKESSKKWLTHKFPLLDDMKWSRQDCLNYWKEQGMPEPPRSSCWMCPLHSDSSWLKLKKEQPKEFAKAVDFDKKIRKLKPKYDLYLHRYGVPLGEVKFNPKDKTKQEDCDGLCDT